MLSYMKGDLLSSPAQVQVNTVNTVGVMGKGIALQYKNKYPDMFKAYQTLCEKKVLDVGTLYIWKSSEKWILLFPTKKHWRNPSKIEYIEMGLKKFADNFERLGIESIAFPKLGCGNGNLEWAQVKPLMEKYLKNLPISVYIYVDNYIDNLPEQKDPNFVEWLRKHPRDLSFNMLKEDLQEAVEQNSDITISGEPYTISWQDNKFVIKNGRVLEITENELCDFWDYIRNTGIVTVDKIPENYREYSDVMLKLLKKLKYLTPVLVANSEDKLDDGAGYQLVEGDRYDI